MRVRQYTIKMIAGVVTITALFRTPCYAFDGNLNTLNKTDKALLIDDLSWKWLSEEERFEYTLKYVPQINRTLGVPTDTFPAQNIHMMEKSDPNYDRSCAYTDYGTKQIYLNMRNINQDAKGGWAALYALAHETQHLYQSRYKTLPNNPLATIDNLEIYNSDPREADANEFAYHFATYILNCVGVEKIGQY